VISIPNGQVSNMSLETLSSRDKFWFHPTFGLKYGTTSAQILDLLDEIRNTLAGNFAIESDSVRVRFLGFGSSSLQMEIFAYAFARDWNQFLEIQEGLLLGVLECMESANVQIAVPSQTIFLATPSSENEVGGRSRTSDEKASDEVTAAKSS